MRPLLYHKLDDNDDVKPQFDELMVYISYGIIDEEEDAAAFNNRILRMRYPLNQDRITRFALVFTHGSMFGFRSRMVTSSYQVLDTDEPNCITFGEGMMTTVYDILAREMIGQYTRLQASITMYTYALDCRYLSMGAR